MTRKKNKEERKTYKIKDIAKNMPIEVTVYTFEELTELFNDSNSTCEKYDCQINIPFDASKENGKIYLRRYDEKDNIVEENIIEEEELNINYAVSHGKFYKKTKLIKTDSYIEYNGIIYSSGSFIGIYMKGVYAFSGYDLDKLLEQLNMSLITKEKENVRTRYKKEDNINE